MQGNDRERMESKREITKERKKKEDGKSWYKIISRCRKKKKLDCESEAHQHNVMYANEVKKITDMLTGSEASKSSLYEDMFNARTLRTGNHRIIG